MSAKTVFISYRRDDAGKAFARLLEQSLKHEGYDVFLDVESIDGGGWAEQILTQVPLQSHFLLLLTPGALSRCADPNDWVRREYELAVRHRRNVVPVRSDSTDIDAARAECPDGMQSVFAWQIATVSHGSFNQDIATLIDRYIPPHKAPASKRSGKPIALPYASLGPLFIGRGEFLTRLRSSLLRATDGRATAIAGKAVHGMGGVGKTRLAVEYAWQHVEDYSAVFFVVADAPESLQRNLAALCGPLVLDLPEQHVTEEDRQLAAVLRWLHEHPGWLLILDNLDTPAAATSAERLLAQLRGGQVLLTGRLSNWSRQVEPLELDVLTVESATEFLMSRTAARRRTTPQDAERAAELAVELGRLALALEQAGAYIAQRRLTFADYLHEWRQQHDKVLDWFDERVMQYPRSVAVTWQTSVDQLTEPARRLLQRLAWFAPDPIPESLLDVIPREGEAPAEPSSSAEPPSSTNGSAGASPSQARDTNMDALVDLATYSLVTREAAAPLFSVHRLVQDVTRRSLRDDPAHHALTESLHWINTAFVGDPQDVRTWPTLTPLSPHARAAALHADQAGITDPTSRLMNQVGQLFMHKAHHAQAEPLLRRALAIDEQSYGAEHPNVAGDLNELAQLFQDTNRLAEAEPLMRRALAIDEQSYGAEHPDVAIDLNSLALLLQATNRLTEAEPLMRRALAIFEQSYGAEHPNVAVNLNNLAQLLQATNRLAEAEPLMRRALTIDEQSYGAEHPRVAIDLNNLAALLQDTNRLAEAEPLMCRALAIDEQSYGAEHSNVARDLNNLAGLLQATNRLAEAEPLMRRALAIDEHSYGAEHPKVAIRLNNLARLLQDTNRLAEAEPLMRRHVEIFLNFTRQTGHEHPHLQAAFANYTHLLTAMGRSATDIESTLRDLRP